MTQGAGSAPSGAQFDRSRVEVPNEETVQEAGVGRQQAAARQQAAGRARQTGPARRAGATPRSRTSTALAVHLFVEVFV
eukprot:scaffold11865_cov55-Phaeocystis_antarctica.AAC.2